MFCELIRAITTDNKLRTMKNKEQMVLIVIDLRLFQ